MNKNTSYDQESDNLILNFVGDIMFARKIKDKLLANDTQIISEDIIRIFKTSDINCANLESPIVIKSRPISPDGFFSISKSIDYLKLLNINILSIANNHIFDCGDLGIEETIEILSQNNIKYVGLGKNYEEAYKPEIVKVKNFSIAFFGATTNKFVTLRKSNYKISFLEEELIFKEFVKKIKQKVDLTVLIYHGGNEFVPFPPPSLREKLQRLLGEVFDVIITHHPHIIGGYEQSDKGFIWYSLGDFIFDSNVPSRKRGCILQLNLTLRKEFNINVFPTLINDDLYINIAPPDISQEIKEKINGFSIYLSEPNYEKGYLFLYLESLFKFQLERILSIYKKEGFLSVIKFILKRLNIFIIYIYRIIRREYNE